MKIQRSKTNNFNYTEEAFLLSTFSEFVKCWKSNKKSRLFIESVNGMAFVNFSVFLGNPSEAHSPQSFPQRRQPSSDTSRKKKSFKKIQRDNERAAKFQAKKRKEQAAASAASGDSPPSATSSKVTDNTRAAASAPSGDPPQTSSPAESSFEAASVNFSFASPLAEDKTSDAMEGVSDPQLSPENLRHQPDDTSTAIIAQVSHNEEIFRQDIAGPSPENITISEEVQQENQDTASKSRLRLASSEPCILHAFNKDNQEPISENITNSEEAQKNGQGLTSDEKAKLFMLLQQTSEQAERLASHRIFFH